MSDKNTNAQYWALILMKGARLNFCYLETEDSLRLIADGACRRSLAPSGERLYTDVLEAIPGKEDLLLGLFVRYGYLDQSEADLVMTEYTLWLAEGDQPDNGESP